MKNKIFHLAGLSGLILAGLMANANAADASSKDLHAQEVKLGQSLYFDTRISFNNTMSCAICHSPAAAFVDPRKTKAHGVVSLGADGHSFGNRNAPTAGYAAASPKFHWDAKKKEYVGGQFWDGRAPTLADQAKGPPLNPKEMAQPNLQAVVNKLKAIPFYQKAFVDVYGKDIWKNPEKAYDAMGKAIMAYESSPAFSTYDSKYDRYLKGEYELTPQEDLGRTLFFSNNNINCSTCHTISRQEDLAKEPFTNFQYRNIGVPRNPAYQQLGYPADYIDEGLAQNPEVKDKAAARGKFKVPSLRNVAVTGPYMHNGVFKHLRTVVEFYNKYNDPKDKINPETGKPWAAPEVADNIAYDELKEQALTPEKIDALVAFMETLTDKRYEPLLARIKKQEAAEQAAKQAAKVAPQPAAKEALKTASK